MLFVQIGQVSRDIAAAKNGQVSINFAATKTVEINIFENVFRNTI